MKILRTSVLFIIILLVACTNGDIKLMNGRFPSENQIEGRVEICYNNVYGTVCDHYWNEFNAQVVCRVLGHTGEGMDGWDECVGIIISSANAYISGNVVEQLYGPSSNNTPAILDNVICNGEEQSLLDCSNQMIGESTDCLPSGVHCGGL